MAYRVDVNGGSFCSTRISYVGFLEHPSVRVRWSVSVRLVYSWFVGGIRLAYSTLVSPLLGSCNKGKVFLTRSCTAVRSHHATFLSTACMLFNI